MCLNIPAPKMFLNSWPWAPFTRQRCTSSSSEIGDVHHVPGSSPDVQRYGCQIRKCLNACHPKCLKAVQDKNRATHSAELQASLQMWWASSAGLTVKSATGRRTGPVIRHYIWKKFILKITAGFFAPCCPSWVRCEVQSSKWKGVQQLRRQMHATFWSK